MIRFLRARIGGEQGVALPMVIGITVVLGLLVTTAVAYATGGFRQAAATQEWSASLAAAYAGVEDYQSRLSEDTSYVQYGNPAAAFSAVSDVRLPTGTNANAAFNVAAGDPWVSIQGSNDNSSFRYEVDNSAYQSSGTIRVRSTGKVGSETRTIVADLRQSGFIDFLYFTDYEIMDPTFSSASNSCVKYWWDGRDGISGNCGEIAFSGGDTIDGPVHSNDTIRICSASFLGAVTTSYRPSSGNKYNSRDSNGNYCSGQYFEVPGSPSFSPVIGMPATNSQHLRETRSDLTTDGVARPGCLYTGPTQITLNSNGTINVRSPWTKKTQITGSPATGGSTPAACGSITALNSTSGATFTLPPSNVIYIQNVPSVSSDPNYWSSSSRPSGLSCVGANNRTDSNGNGNGIGYPISSETAPSGSYGCRNGDLFVKGTLSGQTTLSAEHYIYITGDIKYNNADEDVLGLVGNDAVWVWNPTTGDNRYYHSTLLSGTNRRIDAAILSVGHTFAVQNPSIGSGRGTLTVNGAIAQKFRGIVRSGSGGYVKNYVYDGRLKYTAPPKFLSPVTTTYGVNVWIEVEPAYEASGAAR
ncbi:Flp pilus-assembly TadG-like N-terminal domain-containing protein [Salinibacterium sp. NYA9b]